LKEIRTKRAVRVFVFRDLSRKLLPHAFRRASGRKAGINAISYDIKNLDELMNGLKMRDSILDNLELAIYVTDLATNEIVYANPMTLHMHGTEELEGRICWEAMWNENKRCEFCPIPHLLKNPGKNYQWEWDIDDRHFQMYDSIIPWEKERVAHMHYRVEITKPFSL